MQKLYFFAFPISPLVMSAFYLSTLFRKVVKNNKSSNSNCCTLSSSSPLTFTQLLRNPFQLRAQRRHLHFWSSLYNEVEFSSAPKIMLNRSPSFEDHVDSGPMLIVIGLIWRVLKWAAATARCIKGNQCSNAAGSTSLLGAKSDVQSRLWNSKGLELVFVFIWGRILRWFVRIWIVCLDAATNSFFPIFPLPLRFEICNFEACVIWRLSRCDRVSGRRLFENGFSMRECRYFSVKYDSRAPKYRFLSQTLHNSTPYFTEVELYDALWT